MIWIASFPRSGNTLFRMLLYHYAGIPTYSWHRDPDFITRGVAEMIGHRALPVPPDRIQKLKDTSKMYFTKIHMRYDDLPFRAPSVYIARDGRAALTSWGPYLEGVQNHKNVKLEKGIKRQSWQKHVLSWIGKAPMVRYEEMIETPRRVVHRILKGLGIPFTIKSGATLPSFEKLHKAYPEFFRKGTVDSWRDDMPAATEDLFWQYNGEAMKALDYKRTHPGLQ